MIIVTAGYSYLDIDAYGGCVAYAELLRAQGQDAAAASTAPWNESISRTVRGWNADMLTHYSPAPSDTFVVIDLSNPEYFDRFVDRDKVVGVLDHHLGFEKYWAEKIGSLACIEFIGAACTLVYEAWQAAGLLDMMSQASARLLFAGILDNTLNLGASITTERDRIAYNDLLKRSHLPDSWPAEYFRECQEAILSDLSQALDNDYKPVQYATYPDMILVGQMAVWDATEVTKRIDELAQWFAGQSTDTWFVNLISVGERWSYFICQNPEVKLWLEATLHASFQGDIGKADRLWLRKEIVRQDMLLADSSQG
jgi:nanoRNase/pAp phosphatase (c-di-AMP/oligoRNAs hydrolase)